MAEQDQGNEIVDGLEGIVEASPEPEQKPDDTEDLKRQLEELRSAKAASDERASRAEEQLAGRHNELAQQVGARFAAEESAADSAFNAAQLSLKTAKEAFVAANTEGRFTDAAELMEQIADAKVELRSASFRKEQIAQAKARAAEEAKRQLDAPVDSDPEQRLLAGLSAASASWLKAHPDVLSKMATDSRFFARIAALDNEAYAEGHDRDSAGYFRYIEDKLGEQTSRPAAKMKSGATASAAPSTRRTAGAVQTGRTVHLDDIVRRFTPEMQAAARTSFANLPEEEAQKAYARGIIAQKQRDPSFLPEFKL